MNETISKILSLLSKSGESNYIGEEVSQLEHALQGAYLATQSAADDEVVLAALLHDIGHYCIVDAPQMADLGVMNHEKLGGDFLKGLGFSSRLAGLVSGHVKAKRYLVTTKDVYKNALSEASRQTLEFQGGFMSPQEILDFEAEVEFKNLLKIRAWDDQAKVKGLCVPNLNSYIPILRRHLLMTSAKGNT